MPAEHVLGHTERPVGDAFPENLRLDAICQLGLERLGSTGAVRAGRVLWMMPRVFGGVLADFCEGCLWFFMRMLTNCDKADGQARRNFLEKHNNIHEDASRL